MRDPIRMLESDDLSSLERELLECARSEEPGAAVSGILLAGLSVPFSSYPGQSASSPPSGGRLSPGSEGLNGLLRSATLKGSLVEGSSIAPGAAALGLSSSARLGLKVAAWGATLGLAGTLVFLALKPHEGSSQQRSGVASSRLASPPLEPRRARFEVPGPGPEENTLSEETALPVTPVRDHAALADHTSLPVATKPSPPGDSGAWNASLTAEIAALDPARLALRSGDGAEALALLNRYRARFPAGTLRPEANALRAQAEALLKEP